MGLFRKKPVVIEAVQFHGGKESASEILDFAPEAVWYINRNIISIGTLEGDMIAIPGDWIIRGVKGEFYPCKNSIFRETYEPADADAAKVWSS